MDRGLYDFARGLFRRPQFKPTVAILYVCFAASLWKTAILPTTGFVPGTYRIVFAFVLFGLVPVGIVRFVFREKLADYGLCLGDLPIALRSILIMTPLMLLLGYFSGCDKNFLAVYPLNPAIRPGASGAIFALHLTTYLLYYAGWEFLFRGFLQKAMEPQNGAPTAILVQTLASTMLHYGNPPSEVFGAILGGLFWGFLFFRTRSLLAGFVQHTSLGFTLDYYLVYGE